MSAAKHTPGPWGFDTVSTSVGICHRIGPFPAKRADGKPKHACVYVDYPTPGGEWEKSMEANARLISAAPDLLEALQGAVDMAWAQDSHEVEFDGSVMFGPGYNFDGVDGHEREEFLGAISCIVWPSGGLGPRVWSAYTTHEGYMWFERFVSAADAKEVCMRILDRVLPDHPAMKARAAIAKATGEQA